MHYLNFREEKIHGTPDFPLAFYHVDESHPRYEMPFHWHKELEIIRILKGSFDFYINGKRINARQGDILFVNQSALHGGIPCDCIYECVVFDPLALLMHTDSCRRYIRLLTGQNIRINPALSPDCLPFRKAVWRLFDFARKKEEPGSELFLLGSLFELFGVIYHFHLYEVFTENTSPDTEKIQVLKPVLEYIDQSYMKPVTLDALAKLAGMTPRYFCRFFHAFFHRTPMDYLNYYRIERACDFLSSSSLTVTEAAYRCGFNDSSYFVKVFKKYKGMTPRQYRSANASPPSVS